MLTARNYALAGPGAHVYTGLFWPGSHTSVAWPTTNLVFYLPFRLPSPFVIEELWWGNGATVSGNVDVGIYSAGAGGPEARLLQSGSTAQSGTTALQRVNVTDYTIGRGNFYLAVTVDNTTATLRRASTLAAAVWPSQLCGVFEQTPGGFGLPAAATPVTAATNQYWPVCGFTGSPVR